MFKINIKRKDTGEIINSGEFKNKKKADDWFNAQAAKPHSSFKRYGDFEKEEIDLTPEITAAEAAAAAEKAEIKQLIQNMTPENKKVIRYIIKQLNIEGV